MHLIHIASVLTAASLTLCAVVSGSHVLHEKRTTLHPRWTKGDRVGSTTVLPVRIGLAQNNLDDIYDHLMSISHPSSPSYGKHWSAQDVADTFKPSDRAIAAVRKWLEEAGIASHRVTHSDNKGWLAFQATSEEAENLFHTKFHTYQDAVTGHLLPACDEYHVPKHVQEHIDYITPGIKLLAPYHDAPSKRNAPAWGSQHEDQSPGWPRPPPKSHQPFAPISIEAANLATCDIAITPACVAALYHIPPTNHHLPPNPDNSMGIYESELQFIAQEDLDLFFTNFTKFIPNGTHPIADNIDGGKTFTTNVSMAGGESELDMELSYPIVWPQTITVFNEDDLNYQAEPNQTYTWGFNDFLDAIDGSYCTYSAYGETGSASIDPVYPDTRPNGYNGPLQCGIFKPTTVLSVSYGGQEANLPASYQKRQCNEWAKLGLMGTSVVFASGDAGVGDYPGQYGFSGATGCLGPSGNIFNPTWPNNCPYLTNVGATKVYPGHSVFEPESAAEDPAGAPYTLAYSSGGGFSNIYAVPVYQKTALAVYFAQHDPGYPFYSYLTNDTTSIGADKAIYGDGLYNRIGRGIPDVAANGDNIAVYVGGQFALSGGTSASTPIFASILNRINEERLRIGKSTVGFVNPVLYEHPYVLNDITNGSNPNCNTSGFHSVPGWDPVTGLGTPNYPRMLELFLRLP